MDTRDGQAEVMAFLANPATHGGAVERVDTHISIVFLSGGNAYKLKRAVAFDYLDFSTADRRRRCCEDEVRLNRRTAPGLYRGVLPITRERDGTLALAGQGEAVDWVVHMHRFDQSQLLDRLAQSGSLSLSLMDPLGRRIAALHRSAAPRRDRGGARGMEWVIDGNATGLAQYGGPDTAPVTALMAASRAALERHRDLLERRRLAGAVRECHGDLHLRNIVLHDGMPTLFDGVEFNDDISCTDVLYDLAFLLMDLHHRELSGHANAAWNAYLEETQDFEGLPLMPLFLSCRAAVRAKTSATAASLHRDRGAVEALQGTSREYLAEAVQWLTPPRPVAVALGGLPGTGKSTLAAAIAPDVGGPGAIVLRSDVIRKQLCGVGRFDRLGAAGYTPEVSSRVYAELAERARRVLSAGHSVIVDAVFLRPSDRTAIEAVAQQAGVPLRGFWLEAPDAVLLDRLRLRRNDPSDADADTLAGQRHVDRGPLSWPVLDAEDPHLREKLRPMTTANDGIPTVSAQF